MKNCTYARLKMWKIKFDENCLLIVSVFSIISYEFVFRLDNLYGSKNRKLYKKILTKCTDNKTKLFCNKRINHFQYLENKYTSKYSNI